MDLYIPSTCGHTLGVGATTLTHRFGITTKAFGPRYSYLQYMRDIFTLPDGTLGCDPESYDPATGTCCVPDLDTTHGGANGRRGVLVHSRCCSDPAGVPCVLLLILMLCWP